jgi:hypothetical protein
VRTLEENQSQWGGTRDTVFFITWFGQCLLHVVVTSFGQGLHSIPLKWSNDQLWVPQFSSLAVFSCLRAISTSWSLSPLQCWSHEKHKSKGGKTTCTRLETQQTHAHKPRREHKTRRREFTTQTVLKSLTRWFECVVAKSRSLRMFGECLVFCSMRLWVPFIALRQLGAVGDQIGRQFLPSIGWHTRQSGAPPDMNSSCMVPDLLPYRAQPTIGPSVPLAHQTVRCDQLTVGAGHASPADCAADRWPRAPLAHRTVRWLLAATPLSFSRERRVRRRASLGTGQSGATQAGSGLAELSQIFSIFFWCFS